MTDETLLLRCACGWETSGTEEEILVAAGDHGERVHNMRPTKEEVLAMVQPSSARADPRRSIPKA